MGTDFCFNGVVDVLSEGNLATLSHSKVGRVGAVLKWFFGPLDVKRSIGFATPEMD